MLLKQEQPCILSVAIVPVKTVATRWTNAKYYKDFVYERSRKQSAKVFDTC